ncbi:HD domain-containing protein [Vibrio sp. S9_S30]|uniref:HD-GYP domain-containing protein n=1 Tax=Vibrio sp. S9_S30 TaxID=2720226 RepID=UPI001680A121|nr:HD domain-containing phosphohydrolase [Vibrio sp. S9_S30]MBD1558231.1 HD domain-containing protein [Vibrio sp. S9_S30]
MGLENEILASLQECTKALLVSLKYRDFSTYQHSNCVQKLSLELGRQCGLSGKELNVLCIAATCHDIGKIGIPDDVLMKAGKFEKEEWEVMKTHAEIGESILASTELEGAEYVAKLVRHHHEHVNGNGYPDGLVGDAIPILSRIISIADSYEAMSNTRVYHHARTHREIMGILRQETGLKYDPDIMKIFTVMIENSECKADKQRT